MVSPIAGTCGNAGERFADVTPSACKRPIRICGATDGVVANIVATWPPSRSVTAGAPLRYGTWVSLMPVNFSISTPDKCCELPLPDVAYVISPGRKRASAINSFTLRAGTDGCADNVFGMRVITVIATKSRIGSYGNFGNRNALITCEENPPSVTV